MNRMKEKPATLLERSLAGAALLSAFLSTDQLFRWVIKGEETRSWGWIGVVLLIGFTLYLLWLLGALLSVTYTLEGDHLLLHQNKAHCAIPLGQVQLHRWRTKWVWSGGSADDLPVMEINHYPPIWLGLSQQTWVLHWQDSQGEQRAAAIRPSPELLAAIRTRRVKAAG
jgi:hypothetical protein